MIKFVEFYKRNKNQKGYILNKNKRGFTLMETMLAGALGAMLIYAAIVTPLSLIRQMRGSLDFMDYQVEVQNLAVSIRQDIWDADGDIRFEGNYLILRDKAYKFEDDGVYRRKLGVDKKINDMNLDLKLYEKSFSLSSAELSGERQVALYFNYEYSSFETGGAVIE